MHCFQRNRNVNFGEQSRYRQTECSAARVGNRCWFCTAQYRQHTWLPLLTELVKKSKVLSTEPAGHQKLQVECMIEHSAAFCKHLRSNRSISAFCFLSGGKKVVRGAVIIRKSVPVIYLPPIICYVMFLH